MKEQFLQKQHYVIFISLISIVLLSRLGNLSFWDGRYLWAEDGNIFITQSIALGYKSIFTPYAGYIHLFPRLIALTSNIIDLKYIPTIFFLAWCGAVYYTLFIVFKWSFNQSKSLLFAILSALLVLLQPHSGEVFFNITNAQWFLGIALFLIIIDEDFHLSYLSIFGIGLLGLTGPFSVLYLPVIMLCIIMKKDFTRNWWKYTLLVLCASIQLYFILQFNQSHALTNLNAKQWLSAIAQFLTLGQIKSYEIIFSIVIWSILVRIYLHNDNNHRQNFILFLSAALIILMSALLKSHPGDNFGPMDGNARYYVIPFALLMILALTAKTTGLYTYTLLIMFSLICFTNFTPYYKKDLNYQSYAWLTNFVEKLIIPIHPLIDNSYPGWHIDYTSHNTQPHNVFLVSTESFTTEDMQQTEDTGTFQTLSSDPKIYGKVPDICKQKKYIGIGINLSKEKGAWAQLFYKTAKTEFSEERSLIRWFPKGENTLLYFAFPNTPSDPITEFRFDPSVEIERIRFNELKIYCDK